jgi:hypothetical protein
MRSRRRPRRPRHGAVEAIFEGAATDAGRFAVWARDGDGLRRFGIVRLLFLRLLFLFFALGSVDDNDSRKRHSDG